MTTHTERPNLAGFMQLLKGFYQNFNFRFGIKLVCPEFSRHFGLGTPDVEVVGLQQSQAFFDVEGLVLNVTAIGSARAEVVYIGADLHLIAATLKGHTIAQPLSRGGDV